MRNLGKKLALSFASLLVVLLLGELAARYLVAKHMDPEDLRIRTTDTDVKGRFRSHPTLPYVPTPGYPSHDARGFRGEGFDDVAPEGRLRIACVGGSTTYGHDLPWREAWPAQLEALLREEGLDVEVINAGVPGWVSRESAMSLEERVLPLEPDVVVIYQGRNELFPQSWDAYRDDYLHFRDPDWVFDRTNSGYKALFRISHLALLLCTHDEDRFGWEGRLENPVYGCNLKPNVPTPEGVVANLEDATRTEAYRRNVERMVSAAREAGAEVVLCTFAFRPEKLATGMIPEDEIVRPSLAVQLARNNDAVRDVAEALGVVLAETGVLAEQPELFRDDCHVTADGHRARARIIADAMRAAGWTERE